MEIVFFFSSARWARFIVAEYDIDYSLFLSVQKFRPSVIYLSLSLLSGVRLSSSFGLKKGVPLSPLLSLLSPSKIKKKTKKQKLTKYSFLSFFLSFFSFNFYTQHSERTPPRHKTTRTKTTRRRKRIQKRKSNTSSTKTATSFRNTFQWTSSSNRTTSSTSRSCILR